MIFLLIALFMKRDNPKRKKWNMFGIYYSTAYLLWGVIVKLVILSNATGYFESNNLKTTNAMVTPMPFTSFYWMVLVEDDENYYVGYKSLFYEFNPRDIDTVKKDKTSLYNLKWQGPNYAKKIDFITNGYYTCRLSGDSMYVYDLRFGLASKFSNGQIKTPVKGYGMVIDNNTVQKRVENLPFTNLNKVNFGSYFNKIFSNE
jgi:inner membrane protein